MQLTAPKFHQFMRRPSAAPKTSPSYSPVPGGQAAYDLWVPRRLTFLDREGVRLQAGPTTRECLQRARSLFEDFLTSGDPGHRYLAWLLIAKASSRLAALDRRKTRKDNNHAAL